MSFTKIAQILITFRVRHSRSEYILVTAVYVSVCPSPHSHTTARTRMLVGRMVEGCRLVVHYGADLQSVHGFRCYDNIHVCKL